MAEIGGAELNYQLLESALDLSGKWRTSPTQIWLSTGQVLFALDAMGSRHLLVPLSPHTSVFEDSESAGINVNTRTLLESEIKRRFLDVGCTLPSLRRLFAYVIDEILVALGNDGSNPGQSCLVVLNKWRELFAHASGPKLSESEIVGLIGELSILARIAEVSPTAAMRSWTGWEKERFDFFSGNLAIEVKSTSAREGRNVTIHGITQLEARDDSPLYLLFLRFQKSGPGARSLPDVVDSLLRLGVNSSELNSRLASQRYVPDEREYYSKMRFELVEELCFRVSEGFPRLVPSTFKNDTDLERISGVQYRIDLAGLDPLPKSSLNASIELMGRS